MCTYRHVDNYSIQLHAKKWTTTSDVRFFNGKKVLYSIPRTNCLSNSSNLDMIVLSIISNHIMHRPCLAQLQAVFPHLGRISWFPHHTTTLLAPGACLLLTTHRPRPPSTHHTPNKMMIPLAGRRVRKTFFSLTQKVEKSPHIKNATPKSGVNLREESRSISKTAKITVQWNNFIPCLCVIVWYI